MKFGNRLLIHFFFFIINAFFFSIQEHYDFKNIQNG